MVRILFIVVGRRRRITGKNFFEKITLMKKSTSRVPNTPLGWDVDPSVLKCVLCDFSCKYRSKLDGCGLSFLQLLADKDRPVRFDHVVSAGWFPSAARCLWPTNCGGWVHTKCDACHAQRTQARPNVVEIKSFGHCWFLVVFPPPFLPPPFLPPPPPHPPSFNFDYSSRMRIDLSRPAKRPAL